MPGKPKILFLPSWYPDKNHPTAGIFIKRHAEAVATENIVSVLYVASDEKIRTLKIEAETVENVFTVRVYYRKVNSTVPGILHLIKLKLLISAYFKGYEEIEKQIGKPGLLHLNVIFPAGIFALILNFRKSIPFIISEHWSGYMPEDGNYKGFFMKRITELCVKKAKAVIAVSKKMKEAMLSHGLKNKYYIIPNAVDVNLFKPVIQVSRHEKKRIIHVSTLNDREKNITGILNVIKKLSEKRKNFILDIVGDGADRKQMEELAEELKIKDKMVFFHGQKTPTELARHLNNSDFMLMFSNYEGLPCVILEAFSVGLPVIATNIGGIPEVLTNERGILVPVKAEEKLYEALNNMLESFTGYDRISIRNYAVNNFSYEKVGERLAEIYKEAIKSNLDA